MNNLRNIQGRLNEEMALSSVEGLPKSRISDLFPRCYLYAATDMALQMTGNENEAELERALLIVFQEFYGERGPKYLQELLDIGANEPARSYLNLAAENFSNHIRHFHNEDENEARPSNKFSIYLWEGKVMDDDLEESPDPQNELVDAAEKDTIGPDGGATESDKDTAHLAAEYVLKRINAEMKINSIAGPPKHNKLDLFPQCYLYAATDVALQMAESESEVDLAAATTIVFREFYGEHGPHHLGKLLDVAEKEPARSYLRIAGENFAGLIMDSYKDEESKSHPMKFSIYLWEGKILKE